jgi:hypothetical protein
VYGAPLFENMISAFEPKTVGSVKIMAYAFRAETPAGRRRLPRGEFTPGSLWREKLWSIHPGGHDETGLGEAGTEHQKPLVRA